MTFTQEVVYMFYEYYSDDSLHQTVFVSSMRVLSATLSSSLTGGGIQSILIT